MSSGLEIRLFSHLVLQVTDAVCGNQPGDPYWDSLTNKTNFNFSDHSASNTVIAFVYVYVFVFAMTWACVAWVYPPEVFSLNMRGRGTSMTSATNWFINFWFALYLPTAMAQISWKLYMIFMALCYLMAIVVFLFYPESSGKSLEEMDFLFDKSRTIWVFTDRQARKVGALFERDLAHGEALTAFGDTKNEPIDQVQDASEQQADV